MNIHIYIFLKLFTNLGERLALLVRFPFTTGVIYTQVYACTVTS